MNRFFLPLVLIGALGCASPPPAYVPEDPAPPGTNLAMEIQVIKGDWIVRVNRPAAVALFEIVPNQGVGLVYPEPSVESGNLDPGSTTVRVVDRRLLLLHRTRYLQPWNAGGIIRPRRTVVEEDPGDQMRRGTVVDQATGPRVIVGIACECEMDLEAVIPPDGPRTLVGPFNGLNPHYAAETLVAAILPSMDVSWTMARYEYDIQPSGR